MERLRAETQTPILYISRREDGLFVEDHEGRHRIAALQKAGITNVPVVFRMGDKTGYKDPKKEHQLGDTASIHGQRFGIPGGSGDRSSRIATVRNLTELKF